MALQQPVARSLLCTSERSILSSFASPTPQLSETAQIDSSISELFPDLFHTLEACSKPRAGNRCEPQDEKGRKQRKQEELRREEERLAEEERQRQRAAAQEAARAREAALRRQREAEEAEQKRRLDAARAAVEREEARRRAEKAEAAEAAEAEEEREAAPPSDQALLYKTWSVQKCSYPDTCCAGRVIDMDVQEGAQLDEEEVTDYSFEARWQYRLGFGMIWGQRAHSSP